MHTFRRPTLVALCLLLSACGSAPSPLQPDTPEPIEAESGLGGGGGDTAPLMQAEAGEVPTSDADAPAAPASALPAVASPSPSASTAPSGGGSSGSNGGRSNASPTPTPTPTPTATPTATPTPTPSATPVATTRSLVVAGDRHLVEVKTGKAFGTSPFTITSLTTEAYNNKAAGMKFTALAGATRGRYGWRYGRITAENADEWGGDIGGPGTVFFLDSLGGEADNDGSWVIEERYDDGTEVHEMRTEVLAKSDVCTFDPAKVAFANLGATGGTWRINAAWENAQDAPYSFPAGCFLVFTRPDGVKDFALVGPGETTIAARGYVYAFFITEAPERPDGDLRLTLTPQ
jgi:hypothetical protein